MSQPNINFEQQARRVQAETSAVAQGIKPFNAADWASDADVEEQNLEEREQEVDEFLKDLQRWRSIPSQKELA